MRSTLARLFPFKTLGWKTPGYQNQPERKKEIEQLCHNWHDSHPSLKERGVARGVIRHISSKGLSANIVVDQSTSLSPTQLIMLRWKCTKRMARLSQSTTFRSPKNRSGTSLRYALLFMHQRGAPTCTVKVRIAI